METQGQDPPDAGSAEEPSDATDESKRSSRFPTWVWILAALAGLAIVIGIVLIAVGASEQTDYDDATRTRFLDACTADGGDPVRRTCECIYDGVEAEIPFDRFEEIDSQLSEQASSTGPGDPLPVPEDVQRIVDRCIAETS